MNLGEKMSYLQGLLDGLEIDTTTKEGKLLIQMTEVMHQMVESIDDLQSQVDELTELCDILDEDLGGLEEDYYCCDCDCDCDCEDDDCDCDCCCDEDDYDDFDDYEEYDYNDDEELYEVCCPVCEEKVVLDDSMLDEGSIECPCCGENLEFDFFGVDDDEDDTDTDFFSSDDE
ncbi:MAG: hypothetical protein IJA12_03795 [Oscillospiraceae bacterium]|nr:hypothetical protein [Oscillospiraceae bacterium]